MKKLKTSCTVFLFILSSGPNDDTQWYVVSVTLTSYDRHTITSLQWNTNSTITHISAKRLKETESQSSTDVPGITSIRHCTGVTHVARLIENNEKSAQTDANTARWQSQKISPRRRPPSWRAGRPKFNLLEMVTTFTYKPSLVRIDARNLELSW